MSPGGCSRTFSFDFFSVRQRKASLKETEDSFHESKNKMSPGGCSRTFSFASSASRQRKASLKETEDSFHESKNKMSPGGFEPPSTGFTLCCISEANRTVRIML